MNLHRRLGPKDWMLLGYLVALLLVAAWDALTADAPEPASDPALDTDESLPQYQSLRLGEPALERLERGEPISLERWHGGDLVIRGEAVIDVDQIDTDHDGGRTDE